MIGSVSYNYGRNINAAQPNGNYGEIGVDTTHYTVARLDQTTQSLTMRLDVTATPSCSASRRMLNVSTPSRSIMRAAVSRIWSAVTGSLFLLRGWDNRLTPGDPFRLG